MGYGEKSVYADLIPYLLQVGKLFSIDPRLTVTSVKKCNIKIKKKLWKRNRKNEKATRRNRSNNKYKIGVQEYAKKRREKKLKLPA